MSRAMINPSLLRWARERVGFSPAQVAQKMGVKEVIFFEWEKEDGRSRPTFKQAQNLANLLRIPFGYLFLSAPPQTVSPIADFRTLPLARRGRFSPDLEDTLNDARLKQDWLREWRIQEGSNELPFVGRFNMSASPIEVADDIRRTINIPMVPDKKVKNREEYLRFLIQHSEEVGILILQNSVVLNNNTRPLSIEEFRGFTLSDFYAPVIFINTRDYVAGRIFTLVHELAHLWIGSTGISNATSEESSTNIEIERFCNKVAAEILVSEKIFSQEWEPQDFQSMLDLAQDISDKFCVSVFVVLRQALDQGLISLNEYMVAKDEASELVTPPRQSGDGGTFFYTMRSRNGRVLVGELVVALRQGSVLYREAAQLLNVQPKVIDGIMQRY